MILGWATGGIIFGMMSDSWGRVKTMVATLLVYSGFTGLSGLAQSWVDFTIYRFLVGLGVGGMFGAATTLVAESVPGRVPRDRARRAAGAVGRSATSSDRSSACRSSQARPSSAGGYSGWRVLFFVGILPALLVVPIVFVLREPEAWQARARPRPRASAAQERRFAARAVPRRRAGASNTIVGLFLGVSGMIGLWGIGFFSPELISTALAGAPQRTIDTRARLGHGAPGRRRVPRHDHVHGDRVAA